MSADADQNLYKLTTPVAPEPADARPEDNASDLIADPPVHVEAGNYRLGVAVGVLFGLLGILVLSIFGERQTRRGAAHGFLGRLLVEILLVVLSLLIF